jgi:hypothetical protein
MATGRGVAVVTTAFVQRSCGRRASPPMTADITRDGWSVRALLRCCSVSWSDPHRSTCSCRAPSGAKAGRTPLI